MPADVVTAGIGEIFVTALLVGIWVIYICDWRRRRRVENELEAHAKEAWSRIPKHEDKDAQP